MSRVRIGVSGWSYGPWREAGEPADAERITDRKPPRRKGRDVYVYFDNDQEGHAPRNAARLAEILEGGG